MSDFAVFETALLKLMALEDAEDMLHQLRYPQAPTRKNILAAQTLLNQAKDRIDYALAA